MADPFLKKQPTQIEKQTARKIVENTLNKRTKPVKFTWEGLKNLSLFFETNPFDKLKTERLNDIMEGRSKAQEKDYIDFFEDVEKDLRMYDFKFFKTYCFKSPSGNKFPKFCLILANSSFSP